MCGSWETLDSVKILSRGAGAFSTPDKPMWTTLFFDDPRQSLIPDEPETPKSSHILFYTRKWIAIPHQGAGDNIRIDIISTVEGTGCPREAAPELGIACPAAGSVEAELLETRHLHKLCVNSPVHLWIGNVHLGRMPWWLGTKKSRGSVRIDSRK